MKVERLLLYVLLVATSVSTLLTYQRWRNEQPKVQFAHQFEQYLLKNDQWAGKQLEDVLLVTSESEETSLFEVLGQEGCTVLLVSSFSQCSTCRDGVLEQWKAVIRELPNARLVLVISEGKALTTAEQKMGFATARALDHAMPVFSDPEGELITFFEVALDQTPLCVLVNNSTKRVACIKAAKDPLPILDRTFVAMLKELIH